MCNCKTEEPRFTQVSEDLVLKFYSELMNYCMFIENNLVDGNINGACCQIGVLRERLSQRVREKRAV